MREKASCLVVPALLDALGLAPGEHLLDLGAGPGALALPAAERVAPHGLVLAADVQPAMLDHLERRLQAGRWPVLPVLTEESSLPLPDRSCDAALLANVLGECADPLTLLREVRRVLHPQGRVLVLDWLPRREPVGPPLHQRLQARFGASLLRQAGFAAFSAPQVGPHHWAWLARPAPLADH